MTEHGAVQTYRRGCRCEDCRAANTDAARAWRRSKGIRPGPISGQDHYRWLGDDALAQTKRDRGRRIYKGVGQCQTCERPARDRHHIDGDTGNNAPENIAFLCRRCHMAADGRLARLGYEIGSNR